MEWSDKIFNEGEVLEFETMQVLRAYKYKLNLKPEQEEILGRWISICRYVYNCALEQRIRNYQQFRKSLNYYDQANELISVKESFPFVGDVASQVLQQKLKDLDSAYQKFFKGGGFPKFKSRHGTDGIRFPDGKGLKVDFRKGKRTSFVKIPKIGLIKFVASQDMVGEIRNATITKTNQGFFISFQTRYEIDVRENLKSPVGIDRGVRSMGVTSEGEILDLPVDQIKHLESKMIRAQKNLSRKKIGSNNFKKQKVKLAKIHSRIANLRKDSLHKITTQLTKSHGLIVLENLKTKNMTASAKGTADNHGKNVRQKAGLNKAILRNGWFEFERQLAYKLAWSGGRLTKVTPHYTSQTCNKCGHCEKENRKNESFVCMKCGHKDHADVNAAKNILGRDTTFEPVETVASGRSQKRAVKAKSKKQEPASNVSSSGIPVL